ncbi:hypothetical protein AKJ16_DCAP06789 [Drosera capensis]
MSDAEAMAALIGASSSSAEPYTSDAYPSSDQLDACSTDAAAAGTNGGMNSSQVGSEQAPSHGVVEGTTVELTQAAASYASTNGDGVDNTAAAICGENGNISNDGHGTAYSQQAYETPVPVAAAPVPVQQPATTSQQYYGAYY